MIGDRRFESIESHFKPNLEPCRNLAAVKDVRVLGAIGVVDCMNQWIWRDSAALWSKRGLVASLWAIDLYYAAYIIQPRTSRPLPRRFIKLLLRFSEQLDAVGETSHGVIAANRSVVAPNKEPRSRKICVAISIYYQNLLCSSLRFPQNPTPLTHSLIFKKRVCSRPKQRVSPNTRFNEMQQ